MRMGKGCTDCFFACNPYENWIDNQRKQFLKQKERYDNVINGTSTSSRRRRSAHGGSDNKGYEKIFYEKLKKHGYEGVNDFLELLNNEKACQAVIDNDGGKIDFKNVKSSSASGGTAGGGASGTNDKEKGTFYRSEYCQPCPWCGMKRKNDGGSGNKWEQKNDGKCTSGNLYKPKDKANPTTINYLYSGEG
ncbi:hypothetical protein K1I93_09405, partial [Streptococcus australis]|nr:hypothetical protein [Streptococcus australis]